jgi:hypothetical protein
VKKLNRPLNVRDILALLVQLKAKEAAYPASLLAARRAEFLKNVASIQMHQGQGPSNMNNQGGSSSSTGNPSSAGKILSSSVHTASQTLNGILYAVVGVLSTIILAEVGYLYREEIREFLVPGSGNAESSVKITSPPEVLETPIPSLTSSPTITETITRSPLLPIINPADTDTLQPTSINQPASTLPPVATPTKDNPGLHLGQTKTPKP